MQAVLAGADAEILGAANEEACLQTGPDADVGEGRQPRLEIAFAGGDGVAVDMAERADLERRADG